MRHTIPLGTHVAFRGGSQVYVVDSYQKLLGPCPIDCTLDHDCYDEPYICVRQESWTAFPLSDLQTVFNDAHMGRRPTEEELTPVEE